MGLLLLTRHTHSRPPSRECSLVRSLWKLALPESAPAAPRTTGIWPGLNSATNFAKSAPVARSETPRTLRANFAQLLTTFGAAEPSWARVFRRRRPPTLVPAKVRRSAGRGAGSAEPLSGPAAAAATVWWPVVVDTGPRREAGFAAGPNLP